MTFYDEEEAEIAKAGFFSAYASPSHRDMSQFVLTPTSMVRIVDVTHVDLSRLDDTRVTITYHEVTEELTGTYAIDALMQLRPSALEGRRLRWVKGAWAVHNLIGHPVMQCLAWCKLYGWAMWVHDVTVPKPRGMK